MYFNSSLHHIGFAYEHACRVLGGSLYNGEKKPENARVVMYHASVEHGSEEALGMGADFGLVERIVHVGPPKSIEGSLTFKLLLFQCMHVS